MSRTREVLLTEYGQLQYAHTDNFCPSYIENTISAQVITNEEFILTIHDLLQEIWITREEAHNILSTTTENILHTVIKNTYYTKFKLAFIRRTDRTVALSIFKFVDYKLINEMTRWYFKLILFFAIMTNVPIILIDMYIDSYKRELQVLAILTNLSCILCFMSGVKTFKGTILPPSDHIMAVMLMKILTHPDMNE